MSMNPDEVPAELYYALIYIFNDMTMERKEKFIENSYILQNEFHIIHGDQGQYEYNISDVFNQMTVLYSFLLNSSNEVPSKYLSNYNIIYTVADLADTVYILGNKNPLASALSKDIEISISKNESEYSMTNDFIISFNGSKNTNTTIPFSINSYYMRKPISVDGILDDHVIELSEQFRENTNILAPENLILAVFDIGLIALDAYLGGATTSLEIVTNGMIDSDTVMIGLDIIFSILAPKTNENSSNITNGTVDNMQALLEEGNICIAFSITASFAVRDDGKYSISYFTVDKETLHANLEKWQIENKIDIAYDENDIIQALKTGDLSNLEGIYDYINWCTKQNGL